MDKRGLPLILVLLCLASQLVVLAQPPGFAVHEPLVLDVWPDGSIYVNILLTVEEGPARITLPVIGKPMYALAQQGGDMLPVGFNESSIWVDVPVQGMVNLTYMTAEASFKSGPDWIVRYTCPWSTRIMLPGDALLLGVNASLLDAGYTGEGRIYLELAAGSVSIEYVRVPRYTTTTQSTAPPTHTATSTTSTTPSTPTTASATGPGSTATIPTIATPSSASGRGGSTQPLLYIAAIAVAAAALAYYAHRRVSPREEPMISEDLDERDRAILRLLEEKGELSAPEISRETGIPKSPLYRRLRRLVGEGYLEARRKAGKTLYRLGKRRRAG